MCWTYTGIFVPSTPAPVSGAGIFFYFGTAISAVPGNIEASLVRRIRRRTGKNHAEPAGTNPEMAPEKSRRLRHSPPRFRGGNIFLNILEQISIGIHPVSEFRDKIGFTRLT